MSGFSVFQRAGVAKPAQQNGHWGLALGPTGKALPPDNAPFFGRFQPTPVSDNNPSAEPLPFNRHEKAEDKQKKYHRGVNPVEAEAGEKLMTPPPHLATKLKQRAYENLVLDAYNKYAAAYPERYEAEITAIATARRQDLDTELTREVNGEIVDNFRQWLIKKGNPEEHMKAGWWPSKKVRGVDVPDPKPPKFIQAGGCLSDHPSVHAYLDSFVNARVDYERDLVMMKLEASHGEMQDWSIDRLWRYYKFVVLGLTPDADFDALLSNINILPMGQQPPRTAALPVAPAPVGPAVSSAQPDAAQLAGIQMSQQMLEQQAIMIDAMRTSLSEQAALRAELSSAQRADEERHRQNMAYREQKMRMRAEAAGVPAPPPPPEPAAEDPRVGALAAQLAQSQQQVQELTNAMREIIQAEQERARATVQPLPPAVEDPRVAQLQSALNATVQAANEHVASIQQTVQPVLEAQSQQIAALAAQVAAQATVQPSPPAPATVQPAPTVQPPIPVPTVQPAEMEHTPSPLASNATVQPAPMEAARTVQPAATAVKRKDAEAELEEERLPNVKSRMVTPDQPTVQPAHTTTPPAPTVQSTATTVPKKGISLKTGQAPQDPRYNETLSNARHVAPTVQPSPDAPSLATVQSANTTSPATTVQPASSAVLSVDAWLDANFSADDVALAKRDPQLIRFLMAANRSSVAVKEKVRHAIERERGMRTRESATTVQSASSAAPPLPLDAYLQENFTEEAIAAIKADPQMVKLLTTTDLWKHGKAVKEKIRHFLAKNL